MNRHILWSVPLLNLVFFIGCGGVMVLIFRCRPPAAIGKVLAAPVLLAVTTLLLSCRWLHILGALLLAPLITLRLVRWLAEHASLFPRVVKRRLPVCMILSIGTLVSSLVGPYPLPRLDRLHRSTQSRLRTFS